MEHSKDIVYVKTEQKNWDSMGIIKGHDFDMNNDID